MAPTPAPNIPGVHPSMAKVVQDVLRGTFNQLNPTFRVRRTFFHSRLAYGTSGATEFKFFDSDPANDYIGNLKSTGLPNDNIAILYSAHVRVETGYDLTGSLIGSNGGDQIGAVATPYPLAEALRKIYENGMVRASVGDWNFIDKVHGLYRFPDAGGVDVSLGGNGTAPVLGAVANNGNPGFSDINEFAYPVILPPNKPLRTAVNFQTAIAIPVASVIKFAYMADIITPVNG